MEGKYKLQDEERREEGCAEKLRGVKRRFLSSRAVLSHSSASLGSHLVGSASTMAARLLLTTGYSRNLLTGERKAYTLER